MTQATETGSGPEQEAEQQLTVKSLLEAGVHIGHPTKRWHPKMAPFIYQKRRNIHIINPKLSLDRLNTAADFVSDLVYGGGEVLFVGTKAQASDIIAEEAIRCGSMYINRRWLGGLMTNFTTIQTRIDHIIRLEEQLKKGQLKTQTKREAQKVATEVRRLNSSLGGIKTMTKLPDAIFVVDVLKEKIALAEAKRLGITIIAIVDTNADPTDVDLPIPSNDDAFRAISLITHHISSAIINGRDRFRLAEEERLIAENEIEAIETAAREAAQAAAAARHAEADVSAAESAPASATGEAAAATAPETAPTPEAAPEANPVPVEAAKEEASAESPEAAGTPQAPKATVEAETAPETTPAPVEALKEKAPAEPPEAAGTPEAPEAAAEAEAEPASDEPAPEETADETPKAPDTPEAPEVAVKAEATPASAEPAAEETADESSDAPETPGDAALEESAPDTDAKKTKKKK